MLKEGPIRGFGVFSQGPGLKGVKTDGQGPSWARFVS